MKHFLISLLSFSLISCAVVQGKSSPPQYTSDAAITAQIKTKLVGSDMVSAPTVHVETQNGIVQLSGFVSNRAQIQEAERITRSVPEVKGVVNNLIVSPSSKTRHSA